MDTSAATGTGEIIFSSGTLCGYIIVGIVYLLLPAAAFLWMKHYRAARIYSVLVGAVVYFLAVQFSDLVANIVGYSLPLAERTVLAAEIVCYFEEGGRWLAMRYPVADIRDTRSAFCYGIGHAGLECWIRGLHAFKIYHFGRQINSAGVGQFIEDRSLQRTSELMEELRGFAGNHFGLSLLDVLNGITNFGFHIALSLLIYKKMQQTNFQRRWLLLAILLHMILNASGWLASFSGDALPEKLVGILCGAGIILLVSKIIDGRACMEDIIYRTDTGEQSESL